MKNMLRALLVVAIAATFVGCGSGSKINSAYDRCFGKNSNLTHRVVDKGDGGNSLIITLTDDADPDSGAGVNCILTALKISDALREDISDTTSMMGRQSETENGLTYRWSYHPDNGLEMTITK